MSDVDTLRRHGSIVRWQLCAQHDAICVVAELKIQPTNAHKAKDVKRRRRRHICFYYEYRRQHIHTHTHNDDDDEDDGR